MHLHFPSTSSPSDYLFKKMQNLYQTKATTFQCLLKFSFLPPPFKIIHSTQYSKLLKKKKEVGWGERKGLHRREQPWQQHREGKENKFLSVLKWQKFFMQMLHEGGIDYSTQTHTGQIHFCSFLTYDPSPSYHSLCLYSSNSSPLFSSSRLQPHYFFSGPNPIKSIQLQNFLATKLLNSALTYTRCCCYAFTSYCLQTMSAYLI